MCVCFISPVIFGFNLYGQNGGNGFATWDAADARWCLSQHLLKPVLGVRLPLRRDYVSG